MDKTEKPVLRTLIGIALAYAIVWAVMLAVWSQ